MRIKCRYRFDKIGYIRSFISYNGVTYAIIQMENGRLVETPLKDVTIIERCDL